MIFVVDMGHTITGAGTGAVGLVKETVINRLVGRELINILESNGHKVINATVDKSSNDLYDRVSIANRYKADLYISIHLNASREHNAYGTETYIVGRGGNAEKFAAKVNSALSSLGFTNRGVKTANFYVLRKTNMSSILIELFFLDNDKDVNLYNKIGYSLIAKTIAEAVTGSAVSNIPETNVGSSSPGNNSPAAFIPGNNAEIVNDFLYARDSYGNKNGGRVDIGDKVKVLDVSYSRQLAKMVYPTPNGTKIAYTTNAVNCIRYLYQDQYKNGSTIEPVYEDSNCTRQIGSLDKWERATPLYRENGRLHVVYSTGKGKNTKSGFVKYNGGFNKF